MSNATLETLVSRAAAAMTDPSEHGDLSLAVVRRIPEVESLIAGYVASWHSSAASIQSRRWHRICYKKPLIVTPLDDGTGFPVGESFTAEGCDISLTGASFVHRHPLAPRTVAITFPSGEGMSVSVVTLLRWCRFRRDGFYQSGGQFLRSTPFDGDKAGRVTESLRAS